MEIANKRSWTQLISYLNRTGSKGVPDLRQQKYGKLFQMITGPYKPLKWLKV